MVAAMFLSQLKTESKKKEKEERQEVVAAGQSMN